MKYEDPPKFTYEAVVNAVKNDEVETLKSAVVSVALLSNDQEFAEDLCQKLALHKDPVVRGNAVLGLGHIARRLGSLDLTACIPLLSMALQDSDMYVKAQAEAAVDDIQHFMSVDLGL